MKPLLGLIYGEKLLQVLSVLILAVYPNDACAGFCHPHGAFLHRHATRVAFGANAHGRCHGLALARHYLQGPFQLFNVVKELKRGTFVSDSLSLLFGFPGIQVPNGLRYWECVRARRWTFA